MHRGSMRPGSAACCRRRRGYRKTHRALAAIPAVVPAARHAVDLLEGALTDVADPESREPVARSRNSIATDCENPTRRSPGSCATCRPNRRCRRAGSRKDCPTGSRMARRRPRSLAGWSRAGRSCLRGGGGPPGEHRQRSQRGARIRVRRAPAVSRRARSLARPARLRGAQQRREPRQDGVHHDGRSERARADGADVAADHARLRVGNILRAGIRGRGRAGPPALRQVRRAAEPRAPSPAARAMARRSLPRRTTMG